MFHCSLKIYEQETLRKNYFSERTKYLSVCGRINKLQALKKLKSFSSHSFFRMCTCMDITLNSLAMRICCLLPFRRVNHT
jgi:hypothetical protein